MIVASAARKAREGSDESRRTEGLAVRHIPGGERANRTVEPLPARLLDVDSREGKIPGGEGHCAHTRPTGVRGYTLVRAICSCHRAQWPNRMGWLPRPSRRTPIENMSRASSPRIRWQTDRRRVGAADTRSPATSAGKRPQPGPLRPTAPEQDHIAQRSFRCPDRP